MNVVWFRSDLRVDDNPALFDALQSAEPTLAIYIVCSQQWCAHNDASIKVGFWIENVLRLREELHSLNVPLVILHHPTFSEVAKALPDQLRDWQVSTLYFNSEQPLNEKRRDQQVTSACERAGIKVKEQQGNLLLDPSALKTLGGSPYRVFSPFKRRAMALLSSYSEAPLAMPEKQAVPPQLILPEDPLMIAELTRDYQRVKDLWPAGEGEAHRRLTGFLNSGVESYQRGRDFPALGGTARLSPYLSAGVISARRCLYEAMQQPDGDGRLQWITELLWREFYQHILFHYPSLSRGEDFNSEYQDFPWRDDRQAFRRWCMGETGVPLVDAAMLQLQEEGWMHNRLRMVTAMFLTKNLLIDWRWGEKFFMENLIDGDFAANNGGWQWSASTGTDAAPYFRVMNPAEQARRFDPEGYFVYQYLPQLSGLSGRSLYSPAAHEYRPSLVDLKGSRQRAINAFSKYRSRMPA